jgi:hypothetical protein
MRLWAKIGELRELMRGSPWAGYRTINREYVAKFRKWAEQGDKLFRGMPKDFNPLMLFAPDDVNWGRAEEREEGLKRAEETAEVFLANLAWFRQRLDWLASADFGRHGLAGYLQEIAAVAARELCERHGLPLAYSSSTSAYCKTAGLLFEAMTGKPPGKDGEGLIMRACRAMHAVPIRTETDEKI